MPPDPCTSVLLLISQHAPKYWRPGFFSSQPLPLSWWFSNPWGWRSPILQPLPLSQQWPLVCSALFILFTLQTFQTQIQHVLRAIHFPTCLPHLLVLYWPPGLKCSSNSSIFPAATHSSSRKLLEIGNTGRSRIVVFNRRVQEELLEKVTVKQNRHEGACSGAPRGRVSQEQ